MAGKLGLARLEALLESLNRDLNLENTTLTNVGASTFASTIGVTGVITAEDSILHSIGGAERYIVGPEITQLTNATSTTSGAIVQPANTVITGAGILCTSQAFNHLGTPNWTLNVGTDSDGTGEQILAEAGGQLGSSVGECLAAGAVGSTWSPGEAGSILKLVDKAVLFRTTDTNLYFRVKASSGNPTAGKFRPLLRVVYIGSGS